MIAFLLALCRKCIGFYTQESGKSVPYIIRENDVAWQFCLDPELMVEEAFLQVTNEEIKNYIRHAEYF